MDYIQEDYQIDEHPRFLMPLWCVGKHSRRTEAQYIYSGNSLCGAHYEEELDLQ